MNNEGDNVMKEEKNNRKKWLHLRLTKDEYDRILGNFSKTTERNLSDYARKMLLQKPVTGSYRNRSLDELMTLLMPLRKDLNGIANNFNQAVHKLHTLDQTREFKQWVLTYETQKNALLKQVETVKNFMDKIDDKWLQ
jgi:uncharacterized protein YbgA (DUF1722 family)